MHDSMVLCGWLPAMVMVRAMCRLVPDFPDVVRTFDLEITAWRRIWCRSTCMFNGFRCSMTAAICI